MTITRNVLDHGFVKLRNVAGPTRRFDAPFDADDIDPANTARMSFDGMDKDRTREMDLKLAEYLIKNRHTTPVEMIEIWLEMKMPIFIARQFVRHRTVTINEVSARYVVLPEEWYVPDPRAIGIKPEKVKQGRLILDGVEPTAEAKIFCKMLDETCRNSYQNYTDAIRDGIPNELARCFLHLNHYTHWVWKQDLHNMMRFLMLRAHSHAQWEAQQYGFAIIFMLDEVLPQSMQLFRKYRALEEI